MSKNNIQQKLGKKIRELRKAQGFTQEDFAHHCNTERSYMGCLERGEKKASIVQIEKISKGLKISLSELMKDL
jgi:transcriptional regulator with XRE-family HTH domain